MLADVHLALFSGGVGLDLPMAIINLAMAAGLAVVKHFIGLYLSQRINVPYLTARPSPLEPKVNTTQFGRHQTLDVPLLIDEPSAMKANANAIQFGRQQTLEYPICVALDKRHFPEIALPSSTISKGMQTPTYRYQDHPKFGGVVGLVVCAAMTAVTGALVVDLSSSASNRSSTSSPGQNAPPQARTVMPTRHSRGSGGNPPARSQMGEGSLMARNKHADNSESYSTDQGGSPPPPPPSPLSAQEDPKDVNNRDIDWISLFLLFPLITLFLKRWLARIRSSSEKPPLPPADKPKDVLADMLADMGIMNQNFTQNAICQNVIPLRLSPTLGSDSVVHAGVSNSTLGLRNQRPVPTAFVTLKNMSNGWIKSVSVASFVVFSFTLSFVTLLLFYVTGYYLEGDNLSKAENEEQTAMDENQEQVAETSDVVHASISQPWHIVDSADADEQLLGNNFIIETIMRDLARTESSHYNVGNDAGSDSESITRTQSLRDIMTSALSPPTRGSLNPMARTFVPSRAVADIERQDLASFFKLPPSTTCAIPIVPARHKTEPLENIAEEESEIIGVLGDGALARAIDYDVCP